MNDSSHLYQHHTVCPHCGAIGPPRSYFDRSANWVKLACTLPLFFPFGSLGFFLWRGERQICRNCNRLLPLHPPALSTSVPSNLLGRVLVPNPEVTALQMGARKSTRWGAILAALGATFALGPLTAAVTGGSITATQFLPVLILGGFAGALFRRGAQKRLASQIAAQRQQEGQVLQLATEQNGIVNVTMVAGRLGVTLKQAEAILDDMVDEQRVTMNVTEEGQINYEFTEISK